MSCYGDFRPLWCYVAWNPEQSAQVPTVCGPFKTKTQARKAAERDFGEHPTHRTAIRQIVSYHDAKDRRISLVFDQFLDPTRKKKGEN
jgi:hypothetical protein